MATITDSILGGAIASHLAMSPEATGLFKRVIMMSGSSAAWFASTTHGLARYSAKQLGEENLCPTFDTE